MKCSIDGMIMPVRTQRCISYSTVPNGSLLELSGYFHYLTFVSRAIIAQIAQKDAVLFWVSVTGSDGPPFTLMVQFCWIKACSVWPAALKQKILDSSLCKEIVEKKIF